MLPRLGKVFLVNWKRLFRHPLVMNTVTGGVLSVLGDTVQQGWEKYKNPDRIIDKKRQGVMFLLGFFYGVPLHFWYLILDKMFVGKSMKTVAKKLVLDQLVTSPIDTLCFFTGIAVLQGRQLSEGWAECKEKFVEVYTADCCLWIPAQTINFLFIKPRHRVVFILYITFVWDIYLSYVKFRDDDPPLASDRSAADVQQEALPPSKPLEEKT